MKYNQIAILQGENGWKYLSSCTSKMTDEEVIKRANDYYQKVKMVMVIARKDIAPQTVTQNHPSIPTNREEKK